MGRSAILPVSEHTEQHRTRGGRRPTQRWLEKFYGRERIDRGGGSAGGGRNDADW